MAVSSNSQIGRCRNRESFKNQQNLQKAIREAQRLVDRCDRSPSPHSRSVSPIQVVDPTASTLMALLKGLSDDMDDVSPGNTLAVNKNRSRTVTPMGTLSKQLQTTTQKPIPSTTPKSILTTQKSTTPSDARQSTPNVKIQSPPTTSAKCKSPPLIPIVSLQSPPPTQPPKIQITRTESQKTVTSDSLKASANDEGNFRFKR